MKRNPRQWPKEVAPQALPMLGGIVAATLLASCAHLPVGDKLPAGSAEVTQVQTALALRVPERARQQDHPGAALTGFQTVNFLGSGPCSPCHGNLVDRAGNDVSINNHWRSTMMANAAKDPLWQAKVVSEVQRNPAIKKIIEEKCVTCHMPMAWTQLTAEQKKYNTAGATGIYDGFLDPASKLHEAALDGVSCTLCHQVQDVGLGTVESFSGNFTIDTATPAPERKIFGPYKETFVEAMRTSVGYTPVYGPQTNDSALCAVCHTLFTPYLDAAGKVVGEFPEQTPYLEWLHSEFAEPPGSRHNIEETRENIRTCQECHMPHAPGGGVPIAFPAPPEAKKRDHFSQHFFVGGNVFMLNILQDNLVPLKISASTARLEDTKQRVLDQLQTGTASLALENVRLRSDRLQVDVRVDNLTGHKFPTGIPTRRAWLHLTVADASGKVLFESGGVDADGSISGDDLDAGRGFEPHYQEISRPDQVQIYEGVMANSDNEVTFTLLRAARYLKDNRLLPRGFDKQTAGADIAVYGSALQDKDFAGGSDLVAYAIPLSGETGVLQVHVELLFSPLSHAFVEDLRKDDNLQPVKRFTGYYDRADKTPVAIAATQVQVR